MPRLSVITAVRNANPYIEDAVNSILSQTLKDFEYLIVDDASDDGTSELLDRLARSDARVKLIRNDSVLGPYPSANLALELADSPLIARMDGDDLSHSDRLFQQVRFMERHPDHMLAATSYDGIDSNGNTLYRKHKPADDFCVKWLSRFRMCAEHPTFCFRAFDSDNNPIRYVTDHAVGQDFELLTRLSGMGKVAILPQVLFKYRIHSTNITSTRRLEQKSNILRIATAEQTKSLSDCTVQFLKPFMRSYILQEPASRTTIKSAIYSLRDIAKADCEKEPERRSWIARQTAELIAHGLLKNGGAAKNPRALAAFILHGAPDLPSLSMRVLENSGLLPGWLESYPTVNLC